MTPSRIAGTTLAPSIKDKKGVTVTVGVVQPDDVPSPNAATALLGDRAGSLAFSPIRYMATTYRIWTTRPKKHAYGKLRADEEAEAGSQPGGRDGDDGDDDDDGARRRWRVGGGLVLGVLLLNMLIVVNMWRWGRPGTDGLAWYPTDFLRNVVPIACHSHNDYWRKVPLFSALQAGCISTEADVWLVRDELYVGHNRAALSAGRTFRSLYVDPLVRILERQNPGSQNASAQSTLKHGVFGMQPTQTLVLLVDVKTAGAATFQKVLQQVEPLRARGWLSTYADGHVTYGPVTLVASGNTPFAAVVANTTFRDAFFDAPLAQLDGSVYDTTNSYSASVALRRGLGTVWFGSLRPGQQRRMRQQVQEAHARGLQARYWALPAWPISVRNRIWTALVETGVDLLNVDDIASATQWEW